VHALVLLGVFFARKSRGTRAETARVNIEAELELMAPHNRRPTILDSKSLSTE
jgi:hypothetical protein